MILFNRQILFVHNPKTAGTSLLEFLGRKLVSPVFIAGVNELGTNHPTLSGALDYACKITGNNVEDFRRIISAIRDPYDREVSMYVYFRDVLNNSPYLDQDLREPELKLAVRMAGKLEFREYISWLSSELGTCDIWRSRYYYRTLEGGVPAKLFIIKVENLYVDIDSALQGVDLIKEAAGVARLNVSNRKDTASYFDDTSTQLVTRSYHWMFEDGHYQPTSNYTRTI